MNSCDGRAAEKVHQSPAASSLRGNSTTVLRPIHILHKRVGILFSLPIVSNTLRDKLFRVDQRNFRFAHTYPRRAISRSPASHWIGRAKSPNVRALTADG